MKDEPEERDLKVCPYCKCEFSSRKRFCPDCKKVVMGGEPHTTNMGRDSAK